MKTLTRGAFATPGSAMDFKTGTWRVQKPAHVHSAAPCHTHCPAGEDAQAYIALLQEGKEKAAWEKIVAANPLPAITGRVCYHPCENACNRGEYDEPIAIHSIERYLGDRALEKNWTYPHEAPKESAMKVAVVGAGPAGLATAYHLLKLGYRVELFGDLSEAGGSLHYIPEYRLPKDILVAETQKILALDGLHYHAHSRLGRDLHLDDLQRKFPAIFLGLGAHKSRDWNIGGVVPSDLHQGLDMLKEWMAVGTVPASKSVAIVGGGNTAVDLARVMKRAGIEHVHVVTHNGLPNSGGPIQDLMRAIPREVVQALEEGVQIHSHRGIRRLILRGEKVIGIEMVRMKKLPNAEGKWIRTAFEGTETVLHVDQVIPAIGQKVDTQGLEALMGSCDFFEVSATGQISGQRSLFSGGDAIGHGTVTEAIGDGRRAATAIDQVLQAKTAQIETAKKSLPFNSLNLHYFEHAARAHQSLLPVSERSADAEAESGLSFSDVKYEAERCFSCGNCLACDNCFTLCPDNAVLKTRKLASDGSHYVFDYDYCKGCGLCANECPSGYIFMEEEN